MLTETFTLMLSDQRSYICLCHKAHQVVGIWGGAELVKSAQGVNEDRECLMTRVTDQALPARSCGREGHSIESFAPEWRFSFIYEFIVIE